MEPIESSETSAYNNTLTPGTYPKEKKLQPLILLPPQKFAHVTLLLFCCCVVVFVVVVVVFVVVVVVGRITDLQLSEGA